VTAADDRPQWEIDACLAAGVDRIEDIPEIRDADERSNDDYWDDKQRIHEQSRARYVAEGSGPVDSRPRCRDCGKLKKIKSGGMCAACARAAQRKRASVAAKATAVNTGKPRL